MNSARPIQGTICVALRSFRASKIYKSIKLHRMKNVTSKRYCASPTAKVNQAMPEGGIKRYRPELQYCTLVSVILIGKFYRNLMFIYIVLNFKNNCEIFKKYILQNIYKLYIFKKFVPNLQLRMKWMREPQDRYIIVRQINR